MTIALIVGAGPRLGAALARRFAREGHDIALVARTAGPLEQLAAELRAAGINTAWAAADIAGAESLGAELVRLAERAPITVAVHNVSVWREANVLALTPDQLLSDVAAGAASLLTVAQAVVPGMTEAGGGTILATGSGAADSPSHGAPTLGVQKAALRSLVQSMAADLAPLGVHCASVTIRGILGQGVAFDPERIAEVYAQLAAETAGPREDWRTLVDYPG